MWNYLRLDAGYSILGYPVPNASLSVGRCGLCHSAINCLFGIYIQSKSLDFAGNLICLQVKQEYLIVPLENQLTAIYALLKQHSDQEPNFKVRSQLAFFLSFSSLLRDRCQEIDASVQ